MSFRTQRNFIEGGVKALVAMANDGKGVLGAPKLEAGRFRTPGTGRIRPSISQLVN